MKAHEVLLPFEGLPVLDLELTTSAVEIAAAQRGEAPRAVSYGGPLQVSARGPVLHVGATAEDGWLPWPGQSRRVKLWVPANVRARIVCDMGRLKVSGLEGCDLDISTNAGSMELADVRGRLKLSANAGKLEGERLAGTFFVQAGAGSARLHLVGLDAGTHTVHSTMGSVRVELARGLDVRIEARTVMGSTRTRYPTNPNAAAVLKLEAELGSVRVSEGRAFDDVRRGDWPDWRKTWSAAIPWATAGSGSTASRFGVGEGELAKWWDAARAAVVGPRQPSADELKKILVMVEQKTITADEAERLIRALH